MDTDLLERPDYELRFQSLLDGGKAFAFPCDAAGRVDLDTLAPVARNNYFYARAFVGREFLTPVLRAWNADRRDD